jgi:hypothetical protein
MPFIDKLIYDWGVRCFGAAHMQNRGVRGLRFFEEAIELCQAIGLSKDQLHKAVDIVYSRPKGDWKQEIGGCRVTLTALCEAADLSCDDLYLVEVQRCLAKDPAHFTKRNAEKIALGLDTVDPTRTDRAVGDPHRPARPYPSGGELWRHGPIEEMPDLPGGYAGTGGRADD